MSTPKLQAFYKSRKWESFVSRLKSERADETGAIICEHCGKPIVKAYDCIGHHIAELTDENVDDALIALNPENVMLVHFKCHNKIHKRFGYQGSVQKTVYLVYGSPCAGKTTWVDEVAESGDIVLDMDRLWTAIKPKSCGEYEKPNAIKSNVFGMWDCVLDMIRVRRGKWKNAYIIGGYAMEGVRERLIETIGIDKVIFIDTPREVCIERASQKSEEWIGYVEEWFDRYDPPHID